MIGQIEDDLGRDLTPSERKELRQLLESQRRAQWFWTTIRIWAWWISGIIAGVYATGEFIAKYLKIKIGA